MRTCETPNCDRRARPCGLCDLHKARFQKHGSTAEPHIRKIAFTHVEYTADCWNWKRSKDNHGYGRIGVHNKVLLAHRVVYELLVGPIPDGLELDHLCRNPSCVNPDHLEPVMHVENVRRGDAAQLGDRCKYGHDLNNPDNVYTHTRGRRGRKCKTCALENSRRAYQRRKGEIA